MPSKIERDIDEWFASDEYKAIVKWRNQYEDTVKLVEEATKKCKNEYDAPVVFNNKDTWREGSCYYCCEIWAICGKSKYVQIYIDEDGNRSPFP